MSDRSEPTSPRPERRRRWQRPEVAIETLVLLASMLLVAAANQAFWHGALAGRSIGEWSAWLFLAATYCGLVALNFLPIGLVATRATVRPLLSVLILVSGVASYFMYAYGIVVDSQMVRNALATDLREAGEHVGVGVLTATLLALAGAALPWCFRLRRRALPRALAVRGGALGVSLLLLTGATGIVFHDLSSLLRNDRGMRHTITPANIVWALAQVAAEGAQATAAPPAPLEALARVRVVSEAARKPTLFVMVVGETARAANFSLNGYQRTTNPQLAGINVINFSHATACGTSTEVSLPCMFSPFGRGRYDASRIRRQESALQLLGRAGLRVIWVDNQSGCKGVCDGLEFHDVSHAQVPGVCDADHCYDEVLLHALKGIVEGASADTVVILHQIGNHGPAYYRRYPPEQNRFEPACERQELRLCSREQIVNAYDNAIAYTDGFLADTIRFLDGVRARFDVVLLYVSDHGESLGELGLYLHGMPYPIAPREQLEVPMFWWIPADSAHNIDINTACLRARAAEKASHDNVYHSLLGLLSVRTERYRRELDLFYGCRGGVRAPDPQVAALDRPASH